MVSLLPDDVSVNPTLEESFTIHLGKMLRPSINLNEYLRYISLRYVTLAQFQRCFEQIF